jgi:hypothetical protein
MEALYIESWLLDRSMYPKIWAVRERITCGVMRKEWWARLHRTSLPMTASGAMRSPASLTRLTT